MIGNRIVLDMSDGMITNANSSLVRNIPANLSCTHDILNLLPQPWNQLLSYSVSNNSPYNIDIEQWLREYHGKAGLDWNALVKALSRSHWSTSIDTCQTFRYIYIYL